MAAFVAVAEEGSFTGAALRMNVAQPWVSVQVRQLEELFGMVLFERTKGRLVALSPQGQQLLPVAQKLIAACEDAERAVARIQGRPGEKLALGADPATLYMPDRNDLVRRFLDSTKDVELRIVSATPSELFEALRARRLDLVLTLCPAPDGEFEVMPLYEYDLCCLLPLANVPLQADFAERELDGATVMILPDSYHPAFFSWLKVQLAPYGISWKECPEISYQALIRYSAMLGIATLSPDFSLSLPEMRSDLEVRQITRHPLKVQWALMRLAGGRRTRGAEMFWQMAGQSGLLPKS